MHDLSFFLLKNWLPVGLSAITFFIIGLVLARYVWGRYNSRLSYAIEENLNLAGQWSALGASQRDLFKKLRVRWQADRDVWESSIVEKDQRIAELTRQLLSSGKEVPETSAAASTLLDRLKSLETDLEKERAEVASLRNLASLASANTLPAVPDTGEQTDAAELQARIRDLEQDLIDTHDELHEVRAGYQKQLKLVESLEARLIETPAAKSSIESRLAPVKLAAEIEHRLDQEMVSLSDQSGLVRQLEVLLTERNRELRSYRQQFAKFRKEEVTTMLAELSAREEDASALHAGEKQKFSERIAELTTELEARKAEVETLENELLKRTDEVVELQEKVADFDLLKRRRISLQAELNDSCHELYDVRRALNARLEELTQLEARIATLEPVEAENVALNARIVDLRHELSDVRIAYNEKTAESQKLRAQMEELEAIIEDRGAEVNDLSSELRQQRDQSRQLKNALAAAEEELEALVEDSRVLGKEISAKTEYSEQQKLRVAELELALSRRYTELNIARVESDEKARKAKYLESRLNQLDSEFERRGADFAASDLRVATAENAIAEANARVEELGRRLEQSEGSLAQLQEQLQLVSREKDEAIRDLEQTTRRISQLETAAQSRETQLAEIEREFRESREAGGDLERRVNRLNTELEEAREEQQISRVAISELEEALRASDERTLALSGSLEEKESEIAVLMGELSSLQSLMDSHQGQSAEDASQHMAEVDRLREKLEHRTETIQELQDQISGIMLQRTSRENEIVHLKEKLREVGESLEAATSNGHLANFQPEADLSDPVDPGEFESAIHETLAHPFPDGDGIPLEELGELNGHHTPHIPSGKNPPPQENAAKGDDGGFTIYFEESLATLSEKEREKIDMCARSIRKFGRKAEVTVIGYAGSEGSPDQAEVLSARRADAVRERLLERGVIQSVVKVRGAGQDRRFSDWKARRVELVIIPIAVAESVN